MLCTELQTVVTCAYNLVIFEDLPRELRLHNKKFHQTFWRWGLGMGVHLVDRRHTRQNMSMAGNRKDSMGYICLFITKRGLSALGTIIALIYIVVVKLMI